MTAPEVTAIVERTIADHGDQVVAYLRNIWRESSPDATEVIDALEVLFAQSGLAAEVVKAIEAAFGELRVEEVIYFAAKGLGIYESGSGHRLVSAGKRVET